MTSMWGRYANGRGVAARVRGALAGQKDGAADRGLPDAGPEMAGQGRGGKASGRRQGSAVKGYQPEAGVMPPPPEPRRPSKYGNERVTWNGQKFDSRREMERYSRLLTLERAGEIEQLERQVVFILAPAVVIDGRKRPPLRYVADFTYVERGAKVKTIEDVKGQITEGYRIKRHLMAVMGFEIKETK